MQPNAAPCNIPAKSRDSAPPSSHPAPPPATKSYRSLQLLNRPPSRAGAEQTHLEPPPHAGAKRRKRQRPKRRPGFLRTPRRSPAQIKPTPARQTPPNPAKARHQSNPAKRSHLPSGIVRPTRATRRNSAPQLARPRKTNPPHPHPSSILYPPSSPSLLRPPPLSSRPVIRKPFTQLHRSQRP